MSPEGDTSIDIFLKLPKWSNAQQSLKTSDSVPWSWSLIPGPMVISIIWEFVRIAECQAHYKPIDLESAFLTWSSSDSFAC